MAEDLTLSVSLARKVNLGNYNSAEVFVSISGVKPGMGAEDVNNLLAVEGKIVFAAIAEQMKKKVDDLLQGVL